MRRHSLVIAISLLTLGLANHALAQDRPFAFSVTTARDASKPTVRLDYDVGLGEQTFRADTATGPEQRVGVQASIKRWTLAARFGMSATGDAYHSSQQAELLYSFVPQTDAGFSLAAGGGMLHEVGGVDVLTARLSSGRESATWRMHGNALLQKPLSEGRDAIDLIVSAGWARKITQAVSLGVEGIGEDLEGFWEPEEAEGGARLLIGPTLHIAPAGRVWQMTMAGGPTFRPSRSRFESAALRDLPQRGYAFKVSLSATF